jgi:hypothetical protein
MTAQRTFGILTFNVVDDFACTDDVALFIWVVMAHGRRHPTLTFTTEVTWKFHGEEMVVTASPVQPDAFSDKTPGANEARRKP